MSLPNILFILIDDLGWSDLGCYGSPFYETPHLDKLAAGGMRFTDAYAASPVCSPTRASLLTGKYPSRVGITQYIGGHAVGLLEDVPYFHGLPQSEKALPESLRGGGYQTWHVGKWHLGGGALGPKAHGFDVNIGGCELGYPHRGYLSPWHIPTLADGPPGQYLTDRLTDEAIALLQSRDRTRPFFLNLWHYAVHVPTQAPADLVAKYRAKAAAMGLSDVGTIVEGGAFPCVHKRHERLQRRVVQSDPVYAAMIENLDANVGRLLAALEEEGLARDTLVLFTSDNGGLATAEGSPTCNAPLSEGKGWSQEGGLREPWIACWPGRIPAGTRCAATITSPDLYPTLLEAAGLPLSQKQHVDGVSFLAALEGKPFHRGPIFWHYPHYSNQGGTPTGAMRDGRWKLIEYFEGNRAELFDLENDIGERNNLAEQESARVTAMRQTLARWRGEQGALMPRRNCRWEEQMAS